MASPAEVPSPKDLYDLGWQT